MSPLVDPWALRTYYNFQSWIHIKSSVRIDYFFVDPIKKGGKYPWTTLLAFAHVSFHYGSQDICVPPLSVLLSLAKGRRFFLKLKFDDISMFKTFKDRLFREPKSYYWSLCDLVSMDFSGPISSLATPFHWSSWVICNSPNLPVPLLKMLHFLESVLPLIVGLTASYSFVKIQTNCWISKAQASFLGSRRLSLPNTLPLSTLLCDRNDYYRENLEIISRKAH